MSLKQIRLTVENKGIKVEVDGQFGINEIYEVLSFATKSFVSGHLVNLDELGKEMEKLSKKAKK